jgi:CRISPR-associated protein Cmr2
MTRYIAITFAPVQGFIEKSRKLRDLYGSSFLLSFLAKTICHYADLNRASVIVPALISVTRGAPNNIYLRGELDEDGLRREFDRAWRAVVNTCRQYIEEKYQPNVSATNDRILPWKRVWDLWGSHTWELFIVSGETLDDAREKMARRKQARDWVGINWSGESSTLSGADAIAYPNMTVYHPVSSPNPDAEIRKFYQFLSEAMPEASIEARERLSIPELIKRLITYPQVRHKIRDSFTDLPKIEHLEGFAEVNRKEDARWTGWFQGDGDRMGVYISSLVSEQTEGEARDNILRGFSADMLNWGEALQQRTNQILNNQINGRIVYAGGDDFFGVLYRNPQDGVELTPRECLEQYWYGFKELWGECERPISVSTGFVWAAPGIPQRDLLQHLRITEKSAKTEGRDRLAIRILFNSGNHLDWSCPWGYVKELLTSYRDRDGGENWTHIYKDIATLESRHAFKGDDSSIAQAIFDVYFNRFKITEEDWWNPIPPDDNYQRLEGGLLGIRPDSEIKQHQRRNEWIINLAKVGFHLFV